MLEQILIFFYDFSMLHQFELMHKFYLNQFDEIPITPDVNLPSGPKLTKEETVREKFNYLRKLEALEKKGVELTKKYSMESNLAEMMGEYEMVMAEKERQNSIKFQAQYFL